MDELRGRVAVVTGAASGIGRALAERFVAEGMRVVLADVDPDGLTRTEATLRAAGATVVGVPTDVARAAAVEALAERTLAAFGAVHVLCNNAGVAPAAGPIWEQALADWEWVVGVNLWGVVHGVRTFVPRMLAQGTRGHVVNTASAAGLVSPAFQGSYNVTKHGVVTLSETLARELALLDAPIRVSVLCPGFVDTPILRHSRTFEGSADAAQRHPSVQARLDVLRAGFARALPPAQVAEEVVRAIREERFYILPHPEYVAAVQERADDIVHGRTPAVRR